MTSRSRFLILGVMLALVVGCGGGGSSSSDGSATGAAGPVTPGPGAATTLQSIQSQLDVITTAFANSIPPASAPTLRAIFGDNFNDSGENKTDLIAQLVGPDGGVPGMKVKVVSTTEPLVLPSSSTQVPNDSTHQWFTFSVTDPGKTAEILGPWLAVLDAPSGKWLLLGNQTTPTVELGVPAVTNAQTASNADPCCIFFNVAVPFKTFGFQVPAGTTADGYYFNARWEFSGPVKLCDAPASGIGANCSAAWSSQYQTPPYLNPYNIFDGGGYLAANGGLSSPTTGVASFAFSYHVNAMSTKNPKEYFQVGPLPVTVSAVLAVTVTDPNTKALKVIRSKPIAVLYP